MIRLLSFNIGFCGGHHGITEGRQARGDVKQRLSMLTRLIREGGWDICLLQEVDAWSFRTGFVRQAHMICEQSGMPYFDWAWTWQRPWIPFPLTWNVARHFGLVNAGQLILSRFPLSRMRHLPLSKIASKGAVYNWFNIRRVAQFVQADVPDIGGVVIGNCHLEAFDRDTRQQQGGEIRDWLSLVQGPIVLGGDFNAVPDILPRGTYFSDEPGIDYGLDSTISDFRKFPFHEIADGFADLALEDFPAESPNRRLTYVFGNDFIRFESVERLGDFPISDHRGVSAVLTIRPSLPTNG
ncbi:hypothetical protein EBR96_02060 [bacterium]|nr:hypothetical protein [bacterium]